MFILVNRKAKRNITRSGIKAFVFDKSLNTFDLQHGLVSVDEPNIIFGFVT